MAEVKEEELLLQVDVEAAEESRLPWNMLEYNRIPGLLPFHYYYVDDKVSFQYLTKDWQPVTEYFQKKKGGFETLFFLCSEIIDIVERGEEYMLKPEEYIMRPEQLYWKRWEKKAGLCYLPGHDGNLQKGYTALVEYLLQHTEHGDKQAVQFIYGLYDILTSDGFSLEGLREYFAGFQSVPGTKEEKSAIKEKKRSEDRYFLAYCGGLWEGVPFRRDGLGEYPLPEQKEIQVGRDRRGDIVLPCPEISRRQAVLYRRENQLYLMDKHSANGTFINDKKLSGEEKKPCREGDYIRFANHTFLLVRRRVNKM